MTQPPPALVFSDLDGTLLDHDTYSWQAAEPMLVRLKSLGVPVILASSKTAPEMAVLRTAMDLGPVPMICENGAGLVSATHVLDDRTEYFDLRAKLDQVPSDLRMAFTGFGDMSVDQIIAATGLPPASAALAAERGFSEPGLWSGDEAGLQAFLSCLKASGIAARRGGRFLTLSFGKTKADRMADIQAMFPPCATIALGDAPNDVEMLVAADHGVIIANPSHAALPQLPGEKAGRIIRSKKPGPHGWTEGLSIVLSKLELI